MHVDMLCFTSQEGKSETGKDFAMVWLVWCYTAMSYCNMIQKFNDGKNG